MKYITRVTRLTIAPEKEPIFSEMATHVEIEDEAAGEYISISQDNGSTENGKIRIDSDEWPAIELAVESLIRELRKDGKDG